MKRISFLLLSVGIISSFAGTAGYADLCKDAYLKCVNKTLDTFQGKPSVTSCGTCKEACDNVAASCLFNRLLSYVGPAMGNACLEACNVGTSKEERQHPE